MAKNKIFRIQFIQMGKIYEIYAKEVGQSALYGFVEVAGMVFGEKSAVVIDPGEERLKQEFSGVERCYVPMHAVLRIDEVEKQGTAKIMAFDRSTREGDFSLHGPYTPGLGKDPSDKRD